MGSLIHYFQLTIRATPILSVRRPGIASKSRRVPAQAVTKDAVSFLNAANTGMEVQSDSGIEEQRTPRQKAKMVDGLSPRSFFFFLILPSFITLSNEILNTRRPSPPPDILPHAIASQVTMDSTRRTGDRSGGSRFHGYDHIHTHPMTLRKCCAAGPDPNPFTPVGRRLPPPVKRRRTTANPTPPTTMSSDNPVSPANMSSANSAPRARSSLIQASPVASTIIAVRPQVGRGTSYRTSNGHNRFHTHEIAAECTPRRLPTRQSPPRLPTSCSFPRLRTAYMPQSEVATRPLISIPSEGLCGSAMFPFGPESGSDTPRGAVRISELKPGRVSHVPCNNVPENGSKRPSQRDPFMVTREPGPVYQTQSSSPTALSTGLDVEQLSSIINCKPSVNHQHETPIRSSLRLGEASGLDSSQLERSETLTIDTSEHAPPESQQLVAKQEPPPCMTQQGIHLGVDPEPWTDSLGAGLAQWQESSLPYHGRVAAASQLVSPTSPEQSTLNNTSNTTGIGDDCLFSYPYVAPPEHPVVVVAENYGPALQADRARRAAVSEASRNALFTITHTLMWAFLFFLGLHSYYLVVAVITERRLGSLPPRHIAY